MTILKAIDISGFWAMLFFALGVFKRSVIASPIAELFKTPRAKKNKTKSRNINRFEYSPLRIEYPGAWYHVMNRGACRQPIFKLQRHFEMFLELLEEISLKFQVEVHAYCLMSNHYHLLLHTPKGNLSRAMQHLSSLYTIRYNSLEKRTDGPLFHGRFKSKIIEAESYLLQVSRYIHLNPYKAQMVKKSMTTRGQASLYIPIKKNHQNGFMLLKS